MIFVIVTPQLKIGIYFVKNLLLHRKTVQSARFVHKTRAVNPSSHSIKHPLPHTNTSHDPLGILTQISRHLADFAMVHQLVVSEGAGEAGPQGVLDVGGIT